VVKACQHTGMLLWNAGYCNYPPVKEEGGKKHVKRYA